MHLVLGSPWVVPITENTQMSCIEHALHYYWIAICAISAIGFEWL